MAGFLLEEIKEEHLAEVLDIYNYYVLNTTMTFQFRPLDLAEIREVVFFSNPKYRAFVVVDAGSVCGYVLVNQYKKREAYDAAAEISVYLKPGHVRKGIGGLAMRQAEEFAARQGIRVLVANISGNNAASIGMVEKLGYSKCAHYQQIGEKFGQLLDIVAYQKFIV